MPSFSVGFAQVEHQLGVVRRRLNLLTLQDALYLSGSLVALAAALLIALALRGRAGLFAGAVWAAGAAVAAAVVAAALRIRRRWLSVEQMVHYADRQATLDDRLATLLVDPSRVRSSHLRDVLLDQILAATPSWDVDTLAPRRVPRSVYALVAALAALAASSFFFRPPATPLPSTALRPHQNGADDPSSVVGARSGTERTDAAPPPGGAGAAMQIAGTDGANGGLAAKHAAAAETSGGDHPRAAGSSPAAQNPSAGGAGTAHADGSPDGADSAPRAMTDKLQDAIRNALGADVGADRRGTEGSTETGRAGGPSQDRKADAGAKTQDLTGKSGREPQKEASKKDTSGNTAQPPGASATMPGTGSAATAGARAGESTKELFGSEAGARLVGNESQNLSIKLGSFAAMAPSEAEPQRQAPPVGDLAVGHAGPRDPAPLADEQIADAPLQKADVAPEHEALVRRIFTRDE